MKARNESGAAVFMANKLHDDVLIPGGGAQAPGRGRPAAAFVPIGLALVGVGIVLLGGASIKSPADGGFGAVDQIITGSTTAQGGDEHDGADR
jgi:hypothetical protein